MSFQLSGLFHNYNSISSGSSVSGGISGREPAGSKQLSDFAPGSSLTGQVVESKDGTVTIQLSDSTLISAGLKGGISLEAGSLVTFLVNSNQNNQVTLSPLFTNLGAAPNVENALNAAGLPINDVTSGMVSRMIDQGMGIDKDSLLAMYKQVMSNPQIDSSMVVKLMQMHLAVNELNASQMTAYENLTHQLAGSVEEIAKELAQIFLEGSMKGGVDGVNQKLLLFQGLLELFSGNGKQIEALAAKQAEASAGQLIADHVFWQSGSGNNQMQTAQGSEILADTPADTLADALQKSSIAQILSGEELNTFAAALHENGAGETIVKAFTDGQISAKEALALLDQFLKEVPSGKQILSEAAIGKLLERILQDNWLLSPKEAADKEIVEAFYEKLKNQTGKLSELASSVLGKDAALYQNVSRLSSNIDFMNQLNQTFTYVQIPLKLSGQNANGDLYVYTNKKHLSEKDGSVSAFLHLDMEHLGSVDVYVSMEGEKVSTNFKVANDAVLDLIEANIDLLNDRLQKRGYSLRATVEKSTQETDVLSQMRKDMGQPAVPIAHYSFDAKA